MIRLPIPTFLRNAAAAFLGRRGTVSAQARAADCSRQTVYNDAHQLLRDVQQSDQRCQLLQADCDQLRQQVQALRGQLQQAVPICPTDLQHFAVTAQAMGVSLRQAEELLATLLPKERVPDHTTLGRWTAQAGQRAGAVLAVLDPLCAPAVQTVCSDAIFFRGVATLVNVEPRSLALVSCAKTDDSSALAWEQALQPFVNLEMVVSDAANGIAAAVRAVAATRRAAPAPALAAPASAVPAATKPKSLTHGLDVFHTSREGQRVLNKHWREAEQAWQQAEQADADTRAQRRAARTAQPAAMRAYHAWRRAAQQLALVERLQAAWQRARAALTVFRSDGTLNDRVWAEAEIQAALADLSGPQWSKSRKFLRDRRTLAFLDRLHQRLAIAVPEERLRQACVRRWWLRRHPPTTVATPTTAAERLLPYVQTLIRARAWTAAEEQAYARVKEVLATTVRASSAVEGINSVLRMQQCRHRIVTQGLLDLKRLYWNCRRLPTGQRRDHSPYELLGVRLPSTDFWTLLQTPPEKLTKVVSSSYLPE